MSNLSGSLEASTCGVRRMDEREIAATLGRSARDRRKALALSQEEVAEKVEIAPQFLGRIERGLAMPSVPTLVRLASALGLATDALLGHAPVPAANEPMDPPDVRRLTQQIRQLRLSDRRVVATVASALLRHGEKLGQ